MRKLITVLTILFFFIAAQGILLGALYRIQSWELPRIGDLTIDPLTIGLIVGGTALTLMILKNNWSELAPEEELELDERKLREVKTKERIRDEDELLL